MRQAQGQPRFAGSDRRHRGADSVPQARDVAGEGPDGDLLSGRTPDGQRGQRGQQPALLFLAWDSVRAGAGWAGDMGAGGGDHRRVGWGPEQLRSQNRDDRTQRVPQRRPEPDEKELPPVS